jgi:hypothetical protein
MEAVKFIWGRGDTFDTIHKRLLELVGKFVVSTEDEKNNFEIFSVSEIEESFLPAIWGFSKLADSTMVQDLDLNAMWSFKVEYGKRDERGYSYSIPYTFFIARNSTYEEDCRGILVQENHPFVFYQLI